jgi:hypothetical protein
MEPLTILYQFNKMSSTQSAKPSQPKDTLGIDTLNAWQSRSTKANTKIIK